MADQTGPVSSGARASTVDELHGGSKLGFLRLMTHDLLEALLQVLESDPALAGRLRAALTSTSGRGEVLAATKYMTVGEYAAHARLSDRTIRHFVKDDMEEGVHFHRDGRTGRRVIIHVEEADVWRASRSFAPSHEQTVEDLATNEVLRRRAKTALKKVGLR
jgi:hypothetical protein